jgi:hypothetical protein
VPLSLPLSLPALDLWARLDHRLARTSKTVGILLDLSRLAWRALRLVLRRRHLPGLLDTLLVGLRFLTLQNGGVLGALRMDRLSGKLSTDLLLLLLLLLLEMLSRRGLMLLLWWRPLQDLRGVMTGRSAVHA